MNKRHRSYCFTWNNYTKENIDTLTQAFMEIGPRKYIFQEEIGEENNIPHLQGVVCFRNPVWFNTVKRIDKSIHWEACRDLKGSIKYCSKPMTRKKGTEPHKYNVSDRESWSPLLATKIYKDIGHEKSYDAMRNTMIADVQLEHEKRSKQWDLQLRYQREWYEEMNKLFNPK